MIQVNLLTKLKQTHRERTTVARGKDEGKRQGSGDEHIHTAVFIIE